MLRARLHKEVQATAAGRTYRRWSSSPEAASFSSAPDRVPSHHISLIRTDTIQDPTKVYGRQQLIACT
jgi:hypothetical protein